jgi:ABC-2 type transport system permease protein
MQKIVNTINKYLAIFKVSAQNQLAYWNEVLLGSSFMIVIIFVMIQIWRVIFSENPNSLIAGFSMENMIWYLFITELITTSKSRTIIMIGEEIKSGTVSYLLNKPYSFIQYFLFNSLGEISIRMIIKGIFGGLLMTLFVGSAGINLNILLIVILLLLLSIILDYYLSSFLGMLAFWMEDTKSIRFIYQKLIFIFGGLLFPLDIYPEFFQKVVKFLPFDEILYGPAKMFVRFDLSESLILFKHQIIWIIVFIVLTKILYEKGIKKVDINGG